MLVTTSQLCTLATLFFALMMKIGFFEEEGVPKDVMGQILIYIMFLPAGNPNPNPNPNPTLTLTLP